MFDHCGSTEQGQGYVSRQALETWAVMVIASSRDAYQFTVNSDEQKAFARLCDTLALDQDTQNELIVEAKNELAKRPGLWEVLSSSFSSPFRMGDSPGP